MPLRAEAAEAAEMERDGWASCAAAAVAGVQHRAGGDGRADHPERATVPVHSVFLTIVIIYGRQERHRVCRLPALSRLGGDHSCCAWLLAPGARSGIFLPVHARNRRPGNRGTGEGNDGTLWDRGTTCGGPRRPGLTPRQAAARIRPGLAGERHRLGAVAGADLGEDAVMCFFTM